MKKLVLTEPYVSDRCKHESEETLGIEKRGERMKLSTRAKYGLKALIDLGLYSEKEAVSLQSIAGRQNISVSYLEQLMALLKKAGLVKSVRGAAGGYFLGRPAEEISVGDILRVLEGAWSCNMSGNRR